MYSRNEFRETCHENNVHRQNEPRDFMETFTNEFNLRLSQEMDSMMTMMHSQINRAISSAISDRVIPEIKNSMSSMSSSGNRDNEASSSPNSQENRENNHGLNTKIPKKVSRSVGDLRDTEDSGPYNKMSLIQLGFHHRRNLNHRSVKTFSNKISEISQNRVNIRLTNEFRILKLGE